MIQIPDISLDLNLTQIAKIGRKYEDLSVVAAVATVALPAEAMAVVVVVTAAAAAAANACNCQICLLVQRIFQGIFERKMLIRT